MSKRNVVLTDKCEDLYEEDSVCVESVCSGAMHLCDVPIF